MPIGVVAHHHAPGVARQALGRSSWNARAVLEDALARRIGVRQDFGIDVDHDLVTLPRGAGIETVMQGRLRKQRQGAGTVARLNLLWTSRLGDRAIVSIQNPVQFPTEDSGERVSPEAFPDFSLDVAELIG